MTSTWPEMLPIFADVEERDSIQKLTTAKAATRLASKTFVRNRWLIFIPLIAFVRVAELDKQVSLTLGTEFRQGSECASHPRWTPIPAILRQKSD